MKKLFFVFLFVCAIVATSVAQRTPGLSPSSTIQQTVGVTDFTVSYSRPSLKGRQACGSGSPLAPLGAVWSTGANAATTLGSSTDCTSGGTTIRARRYALAPIPNS